MVSELNDHHQSLRNTATRLGSVSLESRRPNTLGTLGVSDRQDPRPTLTDGPPYPSIFDTRRGSIGVHRVNPIPRVLLFHDCERSTGKLVALNVVSAPEFVFNDARSRIRRHVVPARRTVEDATLTPQHVSAVYLVDGCHLASPLRVEEHNPAVVVRFILKHRRPAAPEPQRDHRIVRREETDRLSG